MLDSFRNFPISWSISGISRGFFLSNMFSEGWVVFLWLSEGGIGFSWLDRSRKAPTLAKAWNGCGDGDCSWLWSLFMGAVFNRIHKKGVSDEIDSRGSELWRLIFGVCGTCGSMRNFVRVVGTQQIAELVAKLGIGGNKESREWKYWTIGDTLSRRRTTNMCGMYIQ